MKPKKTDKVNLQKMRFLFMQIGIILSLSLCLFAFEWSEVETSSSVILNNHISGYIEDDMIHITPPTPPEPVQLKPDVVVETIVITDKPVDDITDAFIEKDGPIDIKIVQTDIKIDIPDEVVETVDFVKVETKPTFPGGELALLQFISQNTKYPEIPFELGIEGKVYVRFVIGVDGRVGNVTVVRGVDDYLDREAIRVISTLPNWTPGKQRGKPVQVAYIIPINFTIE